MMSLEQISWSTLVGNSNESVIVNTYQDLHPSWVYGPEGAWTRDFPEVESFVGGLGQ